MQQAQLIFERLRATSVLAELVGKPGAGHGWPENGQGHDDDCGLVRQESQEAE